MSNRSLDTLTIFTVLSVSGKTSGHDIASVNHRVLRSPLSSRPNPENNGQPSNPIYERTRHWNIRAHHLISVRRPDRRAANVKEAAISFVVRLSLRLPCSRSMSSTSSETLAYQECLRTAARVSYRGVKPNASHAVTASAACRQRLLCRALSDRSSAGCVSTNPIDACAGPAHRVSRSRQRNCRLIGIGKAGPFARCRAQG
jgi:hypothetical protein